VVRAACVAAGGAAVVTTAQRRDAERAATVHLQLFDVERMTEEERKAAADQLRRALGLLEEVAKRDD